ncbi:RNA polymerase sigma factor [Sporosarcina koreensis]|uniref:RNA polymerase sigma factor n=1 Tax=Sporosarcina koreensis TaxID=334735 RepID=UPI00058EB69A|nr:RNA polymerase sigma factor [Sporosarcina koreensis]
MVEDDAVLISAIQQGDEDAMAQLVRRYYDEILRYIYRLGSPYEEAKDLTQETFVAMLQALPAYKEQGTFKAWLYRIARNRAMIYVTRTRRSVEFTDEHDSLHQVSDLEDQFSDRSDVQELLASLPAKQRDALILKYYHGFTAKEIATITKTTVPAVKSRLFQGLQKLRKRAKGVME